ncbi:MAG: preprotein translocase subunit SecY [Patescibacteria group bacterium]|nr:preprotein translocase subunit SecY [Patescibacteria group bacterium]
MFDIFRKVWSLPDLRRRIIYTIIILAVFRVVSHVPIPGVNIASLRSLFAGNLFLGLFDLFSGGSFRNFSVVSLGLNPYINASIIMQLLTMVYPKLEELSKEGESGREQIDQYTRFLTVPLTLLQAYATYFLLSSQGIVGRLAPLPLLTLVLSLSAGTVFLVWLGEILTESGVGNGISVLIFAGIVAGFPTGLGQTLLSATAENSTNVLIFGALALAIVAGVVYINEAVRQVPVEYARRNRAGRSLGSVRSYLPLRVNQAGVIPIIFAISLVLLPTLIAQYLKGFGQNLMLINFSNFLSQAFSTQSLFYNGFYFLLVVAFTYFYTAVTFNPEKISDDIKRYGGFIPGVRPGKATADYLGNILQRITLAGAVFLGLMAVLPSLGQGLTQVTTFSLGGTGILIVVSVVLETLKQVKSQVDTRSYEGFLN